MGVWGTGIYDNDTTLDVHSHLVKLLKDDVPLRKAFTEVIKRYEGLYFNDLMLGLANEQMRYDIVVDENILKQAWSVCEHRAEELIRWMNESEEDQKKREKVLDDFQAELAMFVIKNEEDIEDRAFVKEIDNRVK